MAMEQIEINGEWREAETEVVELVNALRARGAELARAYSVQGLAIEELTAERDRYRAALEDALIAVRDGRLDQAEIILAAVLR